MSASNATSHENPPLAADFLSQAAPAGAILRFEDVAQWETGEARLREASHILDQAKHDAASLLANTRKEGYGAGYEEGLKEGLALIARTKSSVDAYHRNLGTVLTNLVVDLLKQIVGDMNPGAAVAAAVAKALPNIDLGSEVTLLVSPSVVGVVGKYLSSHLDKASASKLIIREDSRLAPTQCRLESSFGLVDLSLNNQLELLAASLRSAHIGI